MIQLPLHCIRSLAILAGVVAAGTAAAQSKTWTLNDTVEPASCTQTSAGNSSGLGNTYGCEQQPTGTVNTLSVSAWSGSASSNYAAAAVTPAGSDGYGVGNASEGGKYAYGSSASVDNGTPGIDALLLNFTSGPEALTNITAGWTGTDGDFQIYRWTGGTVSSNADLFSGKNTSNLVAAGGWELVSTVGGLTAPTSNNQSVSGFNTGLLTSSYWLLSAYNSSITTSASGTNIGTVTSGVDQLMFLSVGTTTAPAKTPEPMSLALVTTALVGMSLARRKRT